MGAIISVIDWCLDRDKHHHRIQQLEDKLSDYGDNIEKITTRTANCFLDCCKKTIYINIV